MIREATYDDLPALIELGRAMHAESPNWSPWRFDAERLRVTLAGLVDAPHGCLLVAESADGLTGGMVAVAARHWCCDVLQATDLALFVDPEHRGGTTAARLVRAYLAWCASRGAVPMAGVSTGVNAERTQALFQALGARPLGTTWIWEASNV